MFPRVGSSIAICVLLAVTGVLVSGCTSSSSPPTRDPSDIAGSTNPKPTSIIVTVTSIFQKQMLSDVIEAFKVAGLEVETDQENTLTDIHGAPDVAVESLRFNIPSKGQDAGGLIFIFANETDQNTVYTYYKELGWYDNGLYYPWVYQKDNVLLQINGIVDEFTADGYGNALSLLQ